MTQTSPECPECGDLDVYRGWTTIREVSYTCSNCGKKFAVKVEEEEED